MCELVVDAAGLFYWARIEFHGGAMKIAIVLVFKVDVNVFINKTFYW